MEAWAKEAFVAADAMTSAQQNATALGGIRVLDDLISAIEEYRQLPDDNIERV